MRLALLALLAIAPAAGALAALDEGPLVYEGAGTDTARFRLRVRVDGDAPVEVEARLTGGFRGRAEAAPAARAGSGAAEDLPATFALDPRSPDAAWRGYAGVWVFDLALDAPNAGGRVEGSFLLVPKGGAGVARSFTLLLTEQRVAVALERSESGSTLRVDVEGGKRAVAAEARVAGVAHPLPRVAPQTFAGPVPGGADAVAVVTFWDGVRLASSSVAVPDDGRRAPLPIAPASRVEPTPTPPPEPEPTEVAFEPRSPGPVATPNAGFALALVGLAVAARFAR